ncbi:MAG: hypothetical protein WBW31_11805 [Candidatus Sulfotelmatobacter sp.]
MDMTVTSTGRTFRRVDDCTALLLLEAFPESFKRIAVGALISVVNTNPPAKTQWLIAHPPSGDNSVWCILCKHVSGAVMYFTGNSYEKDPPVYCGETCPPGVVAEYVRLKSTPLPKVGISESERAAHSAQRDREKNARIY